MLKRAKSRGNKYRLICAKGIFPSQRTFPNSELYITSRHFQRKLTTSILLPLEWGVWLFWRCSNSWNWYSSLSHDEKKREYSKASFVVGKVVQGVRFLLCELCEVFVTLNLSLAVYAPQNIARCQYLIAFEEGDDEKRMQGCDIQRNIDKMHFLWLKVRLKHLLSRQPGGVSRIL